VIFYLQQSQLGVQQGLQVEVIGILWQRLCSQKNFLGINTIFEGVQGDTHSPILVGHTGAAPPVIQGQIA